MIAALITLTCVAAVTACVIALALQCALMRRRIAALRADLTRAQALTWIAWQERDDALASNEDLFAAVCRLHRTKTQLSLALHGQPQHLPWHAGDHVVVDALKSGKAG